jgi:hypothetical protein
VGRRLCPAALPISIGLIVVGAGLTRPLPAAPH